MTRSQKRNRREVRRSVTLARAISKLGITSRASARTLIAAGRVAVNGTAAGDADLWVDPSNDRITLDGRALRPKDHVYLVMNKPPGIVTTRADERGRRTVYDILPAGLPWVFPVGRLDRESSGLLLFTNDTRFGESVAGPEMHMPKTYRVMLDHPLDDSVVTALRSGLSAGGIRYRPARVTRDPHDPRACAVTLTEGKNRQIRRMFGALGYDVLALRRTRIGAVRLGHLSEGEVRPLSAMEKRSMLPLRSQRRSE